jgi:hypothetical protein
MFKNALTQPRLLEMAVKRQYSIGAAPQHETVW